MKIAVIGSRTYPDLTQVWDFVRALPRTALVISGGAHGVDSMAEDVARERRLSRLVYEPQVEDGVSRARYVEALLARNTLIVRAADKVVAFHDGESRGTLDAIRKARAMGKSVEVYEPRKNGTT